ncbi:DUF4265 domain-containing protein [Thermomonas carbonis]|uniref:DUF4265 domain-containing protein n=1 Tax=Thermomonas carbonis TaxID=1463158 RepID=A0A7G9SNB7_9GAMM|nr:DUF4265 domain-containing protein [Thermomonas carbonis]QNN69342.1 DUF4265 domain-containing protein [Thermomonas carbonis]
MTAVSRKRQFAIDTDGDWPPISSEAVWCDQIGNAFRLRNAPFFIKGLAVNDVFEAQPDSVNEHIFEFVVTEPSAHSLIWMLNNTEAEIDPILSKFREVGCSTEALERFALYAIDVPPYVTDSILNDLIDTAEKVGLDLAFPVWRRA